MIFSAAQGSFHNIVVVEKELHGQIILFLVAVVMENIVVENDNILGGGSRSRTQSTPSLLLENWRCHDGYPKIGRCWGIGRR